MDEGAIKTYRYLRIGLVGAVFLLGASVLIERGEVSCWQDSISAYYYTPVRAILVGTLMAIGMALIAIKGRTTWIDVCLNFAGMLAPVVAVIPTTNVGTCWSVEPPADPVVDGKLAPWVVANIDNNMWALILTGIVGLVVAAIIASIAKGPQAVMEIGTAGMRIGLAATLLFLVGALLAFRLWDSFYERAHGFAAVGLFAFLALTALLNARVVRSDPTKRVYFVLYLSIPILMVLAAILVQIPPDWDHRILVLEAIEIGLFGFFWSVQTVELWDETTAARVGTYE